MIDFGLTKMMLIGAVALVVIGPEKLPKVARMAGSLFGRAQRYINDVKAEVGREMELDELRKVHDDVQQAANDVQQSIHRSWTGAEPDRPPPDAERQLRKLKDFRRKKAARAAVPNWYKSRSGHKMRVISAAARVAKYRPAVVATKTTFFS